MERAAGVAGPCREGKGLAGVVVCYALWVPFAVEPPLLQQASVRQTGRAVAHPAVGAPLEVRTSRSETTEGRGFF